MKSLLFLWSAILSSFVFFQTTDAFAQKIYLLAFCDHSDQNQKEVFNSDVMRIESVFRQQGGSSCAVYNDDTPSWFDDEDEAQNAPKWRGTSVYSQKFDNVFDAAISVLRSCPAGSNDTLVVFWSGHGVFQNGKHFLTQKNGAQCARDVLLQEAKNVGARLTVLLTDSCARIPSKALFTDYQYCPYEPVPVVSPLFEELFFNYEGVLNVNAASVGEKAYSCVIKPELPMPDVNGGCFSLALASAQIGGYPFYPGIGKLSVVRRAFANKTPVPFGDTAQIGAFNVFVEQRPNWDEFLQYVRETTDYIYQNIPFGSFNPRASQPRQTIWVINKPTRISRNVRSSNTADNFDSLDWSTSASAHPENGDRVVEINGQAIRNAADVYAKVAASPSTIVLKLVDHRSGDVYYLRTKLYPSSYSSRLGLYINDDPQGGARVTGCASGYPINKCQYAWR